jgi:PAS domain S-box-containing protein
MARDHEVPFRVQFSVPGQQKESPLHAMLQLSPDGTVVVDRDGRMVDLNDRAAAMFEYAQAELVGAPIEILLPEAQRSAHRRQRESYAADPHPRMMGSGLDLVGLRKDGSTLSVDVSLAPLSGSLTGNGHQEGFVVAAIRDVTEARRNEKAAARLAALVTSTDVGMISLTADRVFDSWNPAAQALLGFEPQDVIGAPLDLLVPPEEREPASLLYDRVAQGERLQTIDTRRLHRDGRAVPVALTLSAIRDSHDNLVGFIEVVRDQTERLRLQADLSTAQAERELLAERERIAEDLHDVVIQRVFAAGIAVQGALSLLENSPAARQRLEAVVPELDGAIKDIRTSIFTLQRHRPAPVDLTDP